MAITNGNDFSVDLTTHRLKGAEQIDSPNFNERPSQEISLLVIHNISLPPGDFNSRCVEQFFCNQLDPRQHPYFEEIKDLEVSSHLLIERTGRVVQFVPFDKRAWHAGASHFDGRENCNDFSIGIELEGTDCQPFTEVQYQKLVSIAQSLMRSYPAIRSNRITGHSDIAPGRKTDPGPLFDWDYFRSNLDQTLKLNRKETA